LDHIVWTLIVAAAAFYAGILVGMHSKHPQSHKQSQQQQQHELEQRVRLKVQAILNKRKELVEENKHYENSPLRFGEATSHFALGAARVQKDDFLDTFHSGFPDDHGNVDPAAQEVLIFYNQPSALPVIHREETMMSGAGLLPPKLTAMDATQNCQILHVVTTKSALPQCVALVPQRESFQVQRWMRIAADTGGGISRDLPLAPVGRGQQKNGVNEFEIPSKTAVEINFRQLQTYLDSLSSNLEQLRPLLKRIAVDNTVIVMVCNKGQADLLTNFVCSNTARGLSLQSILVFCTDQETCDIATELGIASFYAKKV
jgi:hypothetical protein